MMAPEGNAWGAGCGAHRAGVVQGNKPRELAESKGGY